MVYLEIPPGFQPRFEVASCFVESDGQILLLLRQDHKPQGNTWGVPAGKVGPGENASQAIQREIVEETGHNYCRSVLVFHHRLFVRYPEYDFVYYIFHLRLANKVQVMINPAEHKDFRWVKPTDALSLPLILDLDACIRLFYG